MPPEGNANRQASESGRYAVVIESAGHNFSAYVPDLPGCISTGASAELAEDAIREAIVLHLEGLREDGVEIPAPSSF